jgi:hypothetical protein
MTSMSAVFGKRQEVQAFAVTLGDGRDVASREMANITHYRDPRSYYGKHIAYKIKVRVEPTAELPFEAEMETPNSKAYVLSTGVRVQVKYDPKNNKTVTFDDDPHAIQARNPQLDPSENQGWLNELLKKEMGR